MPLFIAAAGNTKEGRKVRKHGDAARKTSKTAKRKVTAAA